MARDHLGAALRAMAEAESGDSVSVIDRVCGAAVTLLSLSGAGLSLMIDGELRGTAGMSDRGIGIIQELQLALGEGPCVDAWRQMEPVLEPDLAEPAHVRWPAFAQAGTRAGVAGVFAFPLQLGAVAIGALVLYRARAAPLTGEELALALVLADVATHAILGLQAGVAPEELHEVLSREPAHWAEVHQATGMVSAQLEVSLDEAFVRLRAHAFGDGRMLREVARDVVARRLRVAGTA